MARIFRLLFHITLTHPGCTAAVFDVQQRHENKEEGDGYDFPNGFRGTCKYLM